MGAIKYFLLGFKAWSPGGTHAYYYKCGQELGAPGAAFITTILLNGHTIKLLIKTHFYSHTWVRAALSLNLRSFLVW